MKGLSMSKVFPIQEVSSDFMVNGNGDITIGFSVRLPEFFTMPDGGYLRFQDKIERVINKLPVNATFHQQDLVYESKFDGKIVNGISKGKRDFYKHFYLRPILKHYTNFFITYSLGSIAKTPTTSNSLLKAANYVFGQPFKGINKELEKISANVEAVQQGLKSIDELTVVRMDGDHLKRALYEYFSQEYMLGTKMKWKDKELPDMEFGDGYFKIGNKYVGVVSLRGESKGLYSSFTYDKDLSGKKGFHLNRGIKLPSSFSYPLTLGLPFNHIVNHSIGILDDEDAARIIKGTEIDKSMLSFMGMFSEKSKIKMKAIHGDNVDVGFFQNLANLGLRPCKMMSNVIVCDEDRRVLNEKINMVWDAYQELQDAQGTAENMELMNTFFCSAPGNIKQNFKTKVTTVNHAVCYLPKESQTISHKDGLVFVSRNGEPVLLNMESAYGINNRNGVVFAPSGSGKSVLLNNMINQSVDSDMTTLVIDVGGSYKRNCEINGGHYFDTAIKSNLSFNVFLCEQNANGEYLYNKVDDEGNGGDDQINYVFTVLRNISHGTEQMSKVEREIYKDLIIHYYIHVNNNKLFPDLIGFRDYIDLYQKEVAHDKDHGLFDFYKIQRTLKAYCEGPNKALLNSQDNKRLEEYKYVVFDLQGIAKDEDLLQLVMTVIIRTATHIIENKAGKKRLIIDEAIDSLKGESGEFIGGQYRKIRKANGQVLLATQGIKYLLNIDPLTRDSILGNSDIRMLLSHSSDRDSYPDLRKHLSLVDFDVDLLESLDKGKYEVFFKFADTSFVLRNEITAHNLGVFSTTPADIKELKKLHKKFGHAGMAVDQFVHNKFYKNDVA